MQDCDATIEKMNHIISFAEKERDEARDAMVLQKSNSTIEHGMRYIEALENMRQKTEAMMDTL